VLIFCTEEEINEVIRFLNSLSRATRIPLIKRIMGYVREWRDYYRNNEFSIRLKPFKPLEDWAGKPCCFLNEESGGCDIYPVRIMDCRTLTNLTPCESGKMQTLIPCELHSPGPGRFRFQCERWANNLILEEQQQRLGLSSPQLSSVTPVYHWLWMKRKEF
jgi:Fe-S-cluster containining protein